MYKQIKSILICLIYLIIISECQEIYTKQKINSSMVKIYTKQHQIILLDPIYQNIKISSGVCKFKNSEPQLNQREEILITSKFQKNDQSQALLSRLRNIQHQDTEDIILLEDYIFIFRNFNKVTILKTVLGKLSYYKQYTIVEKKNNQSYYLFKFERQVIIVSQNYLFKCDEFGYSLFKFTKLPGPGLQINPGEAIILTKQSIQLFKKLANGDLIFHHNINFEYLQIVTQIKSLHFLKCKKYGQTIYCLDFNNGLFKFSENMQFKQKIQREGCRNFVVDQSTQTIILDCIFEGQSYIIKYPHETKPHLSQYYFREFFVLKDSNILVLIKNSRMLFFTKDKLKLIRQDNFHYNIRSVVFKQDSDLGITICYLLFQDTLRKFYINFTQSYIDCYSQTPISSQIELQFIQSDSKIYYSNFHIDIVQVKKINSNQWIVILLIFVVITLVILILFIYYYDSTQQKWKKLYIQRKQRKRLEKNIQPKPIDTV